MRGPRLEMSFVVPAQPFANRRQRLRLSHRQGQHAWEMASHSVAQLFELALLPEMNLAGGAACDHPLGGSDAVGYSAKKSPQRHPLCLEGFLIDHVWHGWKPRRALSLCERRRCTGQRQSCE